VDAIVKRSSTGTTVRIEQCDLALLAREILERWLEPAVVTREQLDRHLLAPLVVVAV
jgi:hypothetical protein